MPKISMRDALRDALHEEMARDETIIVLGEDVIAHGGPYAVTRGIYEKYPERIRQTPISEAGIVGTASGGSAVRHAASGGNHVCRFHHLCHG